MVRIQSLPLPTYLPILSIQCNLPELLPACHLPATIPACLLELEQTVLWVLTFGDRWVGRVPLPGRTAPAACPGLSHATCCLPAHLLPACHCLLEPLPACRVSPGVPADSPACLPPAYLLTGTGTPARPAGLHGEPGCHSNVPLPIDYTPFPTIPLLFLPHYIGRHTPYEPVRLPPFLGAICITHCTMSHHTHTHILCLSPHTLGRLTVDVGVIGGISLPPPPPSQFTFISITTCHLPSPPHPKPPPYLTGWMEMPFRVFPFPRHFAISMTSIRCACHCMPPEGRALSHHLHPG